MRPTRAVIDLSAIKHNLGLVRGLVGSRRRIMVAVKANAYGHGLLPVARACVSSHADALGVATLDEARKLRAAGIACPILIFGVEPPGNAPEIIRLGLTATLCTRELAKALSASARRLSSTAKVHINVDTGMGRIGIRPEEVSGFVDFLLGLGSISVEGVYTHFPSADEESQDFTLRQIGIFRGVASYLKQRFGDKLIAHAANSAAIIRYRESHLDMVRPGLMVYGLEPFRGARDAVDLRPAMTLRSEISFIKDVRPGETISYGRTFAAKRRMRVATVPVGYGDGYSRRLSNLGRLLIHGRRVPIVGVVCMDQVMVDVTDIGGARPGDEAVLIGRQGPSEITAEEIADLIGTISYEVVCAISHRVPRVYVGEDT